jgi:hypothetical protein
MAGTKDDKKEACKTYIEQTKLLVALASGFILTPVILIGFVRNDKKLHIVGAHDIQLLVVSEVFLILSILSAYVLMGALAGEQDAGTFNVYRTAIRVFSIAQLLLYLLGISSFGFLLIRWANTF